jgi:hypothetical protein
VCIPLTLNLIYIFCLSSHIYQAKRQQGLDH